jgi:DNA-binding transcriptional ArsR family regulator
MEMSPSTVQREATLLTEAGILRREREGRQVYYRADPDCPIFGELRGIIMKAFGPAEVLREVLAPFRERIQFAFLTGPAGTGSLPEGGAVDLMVVGKAGLEELTPALLEAQGRLQRGIRPVVMRGDQFVKRLKTGEPVVTRAMSEPLVWVLGDEYAAGRPGAAPPA